jgi:hypothetical protein
MPKLHDEWTVLPHGPLTEVGPGLLTVVGQIPMPLGNFPRRMTVVGLPRNRTAIYSPIPLKEAAMKQIERLGNPAFLIVPNPSHRLDIAPFSERYPTARIITAPNARKRVNQAVRVDSTDADLGKTAELAELAGVNRMELAMLVRHKNRGATLLTNDVIGNVGHPVGIGARIMARLMGFGPTARITRPAKWMFIKDKKALAAQFRAWAAIDGLARIIPSHGDIIDPPKPVLLKLADTLEG